MIYGVGVQKVYHNQHEGIVYDHLWEGRATHNIDTNILRGGGIMSDHLLMGGIVYNFILLICGEKGHNQYQHSLVPYPYHVPVWPINQYKLQLVMRDSTPPISSSYTPLPIPTFSLLFMDRFSTSPLHEHVLYSVPDIVVC